MVNELVLESNYRWYGVAPYGKVPGNVYLLAMQICLNPFAGLCYLLINSTGASHTGTVVQKARTIILYLRNRFLYLKVAVLIPCRLKAFVC
jgi:hypothetical protein